MDWNCADITKISWCIYFCVENLQMKCNIHSEQESGTYRMTKD
jgi:hypothetical protein